MRRASPLLAAAFLLLVPAAAFAQRPPCAVCAFVTAPPDPGLLPGRLYGLTVVVRAEPHRDRASAMLGAIADRGGVPGLFVAPGMGSAGTAGARVILVDARGLTGDAEAQAFTLKRTSTDLRGRASGPVTIGLVADEARIDSLLARGLSAYVDAIVSPRTAPLPQGVEQWLDAGTLDHAADAIEGTMTRRAAAWIWTLPDDARRARVVLEDLALAADALPRGLVEAAETDIACDGGDMASFLNPETLERVAYGRHCAPESAPSAAASPVRTVSLASGGTIIRVPPAQDRMVASVSVSGTVTLSAAEIVARHQAAAARQAVRVEAVVSRGTMALTFEAPGFPAPVMVTSTTTLYRSRTRTEFAQRDIRVNGIAFVERGGIPRLPLLEPERVASPPLAIALTDDYAYALDGRDAVNDVECYVIAFEPKDRRRTLFRGKAWISTDDFGVVKLAAAQTALRGPIVASEQRDEFTRVAPGVWVLARSDVRQMYEGAAHRTPIHRVLSLDAHDINPADFARRLAAAYQSDAVVLRDTPEGFRYVARDARPVDASGPPAGSVRTAATAIRTLAFGAIVDPNISRPLPFAGLSYVDVDLLGTGAQFSGFFGGTYGQLAVSLPSVRGTRWQIGGRAFAIATAFNDRAFREGREVYEENLRQRPAQAAVWILRPLGARAALRVGYDLDYTGLDPGGLTAPDFLVPADQVAHGVRVAVEGQRAGWTGSIWWTGARRIGWRPWGRSGPDGYEPRHAEYQRFGVTLARAAVLSPRVTARGELAWMAGRDLDRFSRYAFGAFDNRLHGYPSALIRYDRGAVARGAVAWSLTRMLRLDGFADAVVVHDPGLARGYSRLAGFGSAVEVPLPMGVLAAVEWGYGAQGVRADGGRGTHVVRITGLKVF